MLSKIKKFRKDQVGAISVDWVVLTAAIVGLAVTTIVTIQAATVDLADQTSEGLANQIVGAVDVGASNSGSGS